MAVTHTALRERVDVAEIGGSRAAWVKQESDGAVGELEAFVCQSCGFVEWYAGSPERIPIGPAHRTELIEIPERGPYR